MKAKTQRTAQLALYEAVTVASPSGIKSAIARGADVNGDDGEAVCLALHASNDEIVLLLLDNGASFASATRLGISEDDWDEAVDILLTECVDDELIDAAKTILAPYKRNVVPDYIGREAAGVACEDSNARMLDCLLQGGVWLCQDYDVCAAARYASKCGDMQILQVLAKRRPWFAAECGDECFAAAQRGGHRTVSTFLKNIGVPLRESVSNAAQLGDTKKLQALLKNDPMQRFSVLALISACAGDRTDCIRVALKRTRLRRRTFGQALLESKQGNPAAIPGILRNGAKIADVFYPLLSRRSWSECDCQQILAGIDFCVNVAPQPASEVCSALQRCADAARRIRVGGQQVGSVQSSRLLMQIHKELNRLTSQVGFKHVIPMHILAELL
jgi:hypothetical protein